MIIFLDFDGVLHPFSARNDATGQLVFLPRLERFLREFPLIRIVITSEWRIRHRFDTLQAFFADDIGNRIIGITPEIEIDASSGQSWIGCRQREAMAFLETSGLPQNTPWVALDDTPECWLPGAPLVLCEDGLGEPELLALRQLISLQCGSDKHIAEWNEEPSQ